MWYSYETPDPQVAETLRKAKDLIEQGWIQNRFEEPKYKKTFFGLLTRLDGKSYCMLGAINAVAFGSLRSRTEYFLREAVTYDIIGWNDTTGRTKEQVLAAFDKAIAFAEGIEKLPPQKRFSITKKDHLLYGLHYMYKYIDYPEVEKKFYVLNEVESHVNAMPAPEPSYAEEISEVGVK